MNIRQLRPLGFIIIFIVLSSFALGLAQAQKLPAAIAAVDGPVHDGQALVKDGKFAEALAKFGEAQGATAAIPQANLRLFYQITARLGSATALDGMQRYDAALEHAEWTNQTLATPAAKQIPDALRAAAHHMCGVILYHLKRGDEAKAFFEEAAKEGDKTAGDWEKAVAAPPVPTRPAELVALADGEAQRGKLDEALLLYVLALQQYDELGSRAAAPVMERALEVALRMEPPPVIPDGAGERLKLADAALQSGKSVDLEAARDLLQDSVIEVPWWGEGWKRLADLEERLGDLPTARGALRFYLKAAPKARDQGAIEQRIADLGQRIAPGGGSASSGLAAAADTPAPAPTPTPSAPAITDLSGNWSTVDGRIIAIKQNGSQVSWSSCCKQGHEDLVVTVSGTFDGRTMTGTYQFRENQAHGNGESSYTLNGDRLEGTWKAPDGKTFHSALLRVRDTTTQSLAGNWTTVSGHAAVLTQTGNQVSWTACCRSSHPNWTADITTTFDGKNLTGLLHWKDSGKEGNGTVSYALKGDNQLEGELMIQGRHEPYHSVLTRQIDSSLAGMWKLDDGRTIEIKQTGSQVSWDVQGGPGHETRVGKVMATFDGKELVGTYQFVEGSVQGLGTLHLALDGNRLDGTFVSLNPPGQNRHAVITRP